MGYSVEEWTNVEQRLKEQLESDKPLIEKIKPKKERRAPSNYSLKDFGLIGRIFEAEYPHLAHRGHIAQKEEMLEAGVDNCALLKWPRIVK